MPSKKTLKSAPDPVNDGSKNNQSLGGAIATPMELIQIALAFGLVSKRMMLARTTEDGKKSGGRDYPPSADRIIRTAFEEAAHIYHLAATVARNARVRAPLESQGAADRAHLKARAIHHIWVEAHKTGNHGTLETAARKSRFKSIPRFISGLTLFGCRVSKNSMVSDGEISLFRHIRSEWNRWCDSERKRHSRSAGKGLSWSRPAAPSEDWLLKNLLECAGAAAVELDASLFSDLHVEDVFEDFGDTLSVD